MLDLSAVRCQIDSMVADQAEVGNVTYEERVEAALAQLKRWNEDWATLDERLAQSHTPWQTPRIFQGPLAQGIAPPARPERLSVAATDGSQIFPDRHEVSPCFLLNIGYVLLHYGTDDRPLLSSRPTLYWRDEDLFPQWGGRRTAVNRELVGFRRSLLELTELAELAAASQAAGHPTVALTDGTLVFWGLDARPPDFRAASLAALCSAFDLLQSRGVPIAGYISRPGSPELVNALRVGLCPMDEAAECERCPWLGQVPPCAPVEGVSDAVLFRRVLNPGERSAVFENRSRVLQDYGAHQVFFFYVHAGDEVGRVEIPRYVAQDKDLLELVHGTIVDQAAKGRGYPVSLAEAHERAVVRGTDREGFYRHLEEVFVRHDIDARVSRKSLRKRTVGV
jgi:hypothetical protein